MRNTVYGCHEGVFAHGQVYVLWSRVADPIHFHAIGLPPFDMLDGVAKAWAEAGLDVDDCFTKPFRATGDWQHKRASSTQAATQFVSHRLTRSRVQEANVRVGLKPLSTLIDPQPSTASVLRQLFDWIDRADQASQAGERVPDFTTPAGLPIFPKE